LGLKAFSTKLEVQRVHLIFVLLLLIVELQIERHLMV